MRHGRQKKNGTQHDSHAVPAQTPPETTPIPFGQRLTCTIAEACEATGLGRTKLYELIGAGCLATTTIGRRRLVIVRSLQTLIEEDASQVTGA